MLKMKTDLGLSLYTNINSKASHGGTGYLMQEG